MTVVRLVARPMLASTFVVQGIKTLRSPEPVSPGAQKVTDTVAPKLQQVSSAVPSDAATLVRINAAVQAGAGLALAAGKFPRVAALALAGTLVPTTIAGHRFWEAETEDEKKAQQTHFVKNVSLVGGLLVAGIDRAGRPGLKWRAQRAKAEGKREGAMITRGAKVGSKRARGKAKKKAKKLTS